MSMRKWNNNSLRDKDSWQPSTFTSIPEYHQGVFSYIYRDIPLTHHCNIILCQQSLPSLTTMSYALSMAPHQYALLSLVQQTLYVTWLNNATEQYQGMHSGISMQCCIVCWQDSQWGSECIWTQIDGYPSIHIDTCIFVLVYCSQMKSFL